MSEEQKDNKETVYKCPHCLNITTKIITQKNDLNGKSEKVIFCDFDPCGFSGAENDFEVVVPLPADDKIKAMRGDPEDIASEMFNAAAAEEAIQARKIVPEGTVFFYAGDALDIALPGGINNSSRKIFSGVFYTNDESDIADVYNAIINKKKVELGAGRVYLKAFNVVGV